MTTTVVWDDPNERLFRTGLDRGVLYPRDQEGVAWNGITSCEESGDTSATVLYRDGVIFLADVEAGDYTGSLTAWHYPDEFAECLGMPQVATGFFADGQKPKQFDLCYRSLIGKGGKADPFGFEIHMFWNMMAQIRTRTRKTLSNAIEMMEFSFDFVATPNKVPGLRPTAHFIIDTRWLSDEAIQEVENIIYGDGTTPARLPHPSEIFDIVKYGDGLTFIDHGDGTWTGYGSAVNIVDNGDGTWNIYNATGTDHGDGTYSLQDTPKEP